LVDFGFSSEIGDSSRRRLLNGFGRNENILFVAVIGEKEE
jgi:hypothetical protein